MRRMRRLSGLAVLLFLLAACGGGTGGGGYDSASAVAKGAGCTGAKPIASADLEMFVTEGIDCTFNGNATTVDWFKSADGLKNYKDIADKMGGGFILYGDNFAVVCDNRADCDAMQKNAGGTVG